TGDLFTVGLMQSIGATLTVPAGGHLRAKEIGLGFGAYVTLAGGQIESEETLYNEGTIEGSGRISGAFDNEGLVIVGPGQVLEFEGVNLNRPGGHMRVGGSIRYLGSVQFDSALLTLGVGG